MSKYLSTQNEILDFFGCTPLLYATIRVTGKCNLFCKHCYANASNQIDVTNELSTTEINNVLHYLHDRGVRRLSISGGEPFCRADIYSILQQASDLDFDIYISTNGYNDFDLKRLQSLRIKVLQISIDGLSDTHDRIRGRMESFANATRFLRKAHQLESVTVGVAFSLMRSNMHETVSLYNYLCENNLADIFSVIPVQKLGRASQDDVLSVEELCDVLSQLADYHIQKSHGIELNIMVPPAIVPRQLAGTKFGKGYICEFPYSIAVDPNGNCAICDGLLNLSDFRSMSVRHNEDYADGLHQCDASKQWLNTSPEKLSGVCSQCCFVNFCCGGCRVDAYVNTGDVYASDPLCQRYYDNGLFPSEYLLK